MTLPFERTRSLVNTRSFLLSLLDPKKTPKIPKEIRTRARSLLKHFPSPLDLEQITEKCTNILEKYKYDEQ
jgi:hypothetical protein